MRRILVLFSVMFFVSSSMAVGLKRIALRPVNDGDVIEWINVGLPNNSSCVRDWSPSNYVIAYDYAEDLYEFSDSPDLGTITNVELVFKVSEISEQDADFFVRIFLPGQGNWWFYITPYELTMTPSYYRINLTYNPATLGDLTWDDVNSMQAGPVCSPLESHAGCKVTYGYMLVYYNEY